MRELLRAKEGAAIVRDDNVEELSNPSMESAKESRQPLGNELFWFGWLPEGVRVEKQGWGTGTRAKLEAARCFHGRSRDRREAEAEHAALTEVDGESATEAR